MGRAAAFGATAAFPELAIPVGLASAGVNAIRDATRGLESFAEGLVAANRRLGQFSAPIGMAYAQLGVHEFQRQFATANVVAPTTVGLVQAVDQMRQEFQPYRAAGINVANLAGGAAAGFSAELARNMAIIPGLIQTLIDRNDPSGAGSQDLGRRLAKAIFGEFNPLMVDALNKLGDLLGYADLGTKALENANKMKQPTMQIGPWDELISEQARARKMPLHGGPGAPFGNFKGVHGPHGGLE